MTPKEKAKELVDKFKPYSDEGYGKSSAEECANIAVYEILSLLFQHHEIDYWKKVKEEINRL